MRIQRFDRFFAACAFCLAAATALGQSPDDTFTTYTAFIPKPATVRLTGASAFYLTPSVKIKAECDEAKFAASQLESWISALELANAPRHTTPRGDAALSTASPRAVRFVKSQADLGPEGYEIRVTFRGVVITASGSGGFLYGAQTFRQMLPPTAQAVPEMPLKVPSIEVKDSPRFAWRGLMIDCSRHWFPMEEMKKIVDMMASQKLNSLHWHLTDDQGWRLQIRKYPDLTEKGTWRDEVGWNLPTTSTAHYRPQDGKYGGFYTQDDARALVKYAAERNITVVPEIEIPGHAGALLSVFPQFGCVTTSGTAAKTDIVCAGNDRAMEFYDDVLTEVAELFPGQYIHIGGDEANRSAWKNCPRCKDLMTRENMSDEAKLQNRVTARMEKKLNELGKTLIGWDEILEGDNLSSTAAVMAWREDGIKARDRAIAAGHEVVMSPTSHCYFDYSQEPGEHGISLKGVYTFDPEKGTSLTQQQRNLLKGGQANVWTERIPNEQRLEYMIAPRVGALAEVLWSPADRRDWTDFRKRLDEQVKRYEAMGFNYRKLDPEP